MLEKLEEAKVWAAEAAELLSSGRSVGELAMVQLLDLQARAEQSRSHSSSSPCSRSA